MLSSGDVSDDGNSGGFHDALINTLMHCPQAGVEREYEK